MQSFVHNAESFLHAILKSVSLVVSTKYIAIQLQQAGLDLLLEVLGIGLSSRANLLKDNSANKKLTRFAFKQNHEVALTCPKVDDT